MTPLTALADKHVAVFGLGGSGLASATALVAGGARVSAWDDTPASRARAAAAGLTIADLRMADWADIDSLLLAPGVPLTHPKPHWIVERAQAAGVEIIGDIELFCRQRRATRPESSFVAITGTNGKSTTTALVAHLFGCFGYGVAVGGNIGTPILALPPPAEGRVHVIECSSFQIDLAPSLDPSVGILLNVTPDHLDRHGTMGRYAAIKERLVARAARAVVAPDDAYTAAIAARLEAAKRLVTLVSALEKPVIADGIVAEGTRLKRRIAGRDAPLADLAGIAALRGRHNAQNAAAAVAALGDLADDKARLQHALSSFAGLPHRIEQVGRAGKVLFVNDSKATNADAAEKALLSFEQIFWILGGRMKEGGIEPLRPLFGKIAKGYLVGEASEAFAAAIGDAFPVERCGTLPVAVERAARDAGKSACSAPIVLLSPACASFDQYPDFEKRGDHFRGIVHALLGAKANA